MKKLTRLPAGRILPGIFVLLPLILILFAVGFLFAPNVWAQSSADCLKQYHAGQAKCSDAARACIDACPGAQGVDLTPLGDCLRSCNRQENSCDDAAQAAYDICIKGGQAQPKEEIPAQTETETIFINLPDPNEWPNPRDLIFHYLLREAARFNVRVPSYWEIKPEDFVISRGAPRPEGGNIWIVESRRKVWIKAKGEKEYKPFDSKTTIEPGSYIKTETPVDFWVKGVGLVQLRPGPSGSGMFAVEEINGQVSPFLLLGEMEVKYGKPIEEATQKPIDWEQIKFIVRTPNSSVTVSRTHYLVRHDEKENETTVVVLEGEVEVAPHGGEPVTVTPKNGEPGAVIIAQKLSVVKLAVVGLVLVVIIGSAVFLLKRNRKKK